MSSESKSFAPGKVLTAADFPPSSETFRIFPNSEDDEIVISGISGRFPKCDNVEQLAHNLYNKIDCITDEEARWSHTTCQEIPKRKGVLNNLAKFDATFFGIHAKQAHTMDPQGRILIECAYEAILDAGLHPQALRDTSVGCYNAVCLSESEKTSVYEDVSQVETFSLSGCSRAMMANRISYCLGLNGPSFTVDTACSSAMFALDSAFSAIRSGQCESAIVCGSNLLLHPYTTLSFYRLGVLSEDGTCRPFDENANGYTRSEAVCALFLQKRSAAKRIYANLVYSNTNCDGYKPEGITYPSSAMQEKLMSEFYQNLRLDPRDVVYVEAHGTGTKIGDPEECGALDRVFCNDRPEPLLVGSVKSSVGHSEGSSATCSLIKVILAFEKGIISPNINFSELRKELAGFQEGRMKVVLDPTELAGDYAAVNSFGFGGANAHALLKRFNKDKVNNGMPEDDLPRLVFWAGRTNEAVDSIFDRLESTPLDAEFVGLLHSIQHYEHSGFLYRGYTLVEKADLNNNTEGNANAKCISRAVEFFDHEKRPVVWMFTGMGSQWAGMAASLIKIDIFRKSIEKCHKILEPFGIDLITIVTSQEKTTFDNIVNAFVGISAIQVALVDLLRVLGIPMDYCIGHSLGELGCAYADGSFTAEQMLLASYARGIVSIETNVVYGSMAAVGLSYEEIKDRVPSTIDIACHNSSNSTTLSGPKDDVNKFVEELMAEKVFAKEVPCSNIPYHSRYIAGMGPKLLAKLKEVVPEPKRRTEKWISTSVPKEHWNEDKAQFSSAEYHTNNLLSSVLFEEAAKNLPEDAITIEVAPHGLLQSIIKRCVPNGVHIPLTHRANKDGASFFLQSLGRLFLNGVSIPIDKLYPAIQYPVSRGTPMIAPLIKWDHQEDYMVAKFDATKDITSERKVTINIKDEDQQYMKGHIIDGRCLLPATSYLHLVRETISTISRTTMDTMMVEFDNVKFMRATTLVPETAVNLTIVIHIGSGNFEISEGTTAVMSGNVKVVTDAAPITDLSQYIEPQSDPITLDAKDFYKELRLRGYNYAGIFRNVVEASSTGESGKIKWENNWPAFMDCMLQVNILAIDSRSLYVPTSIRKIRINAEKHLAAVAALDPENPLMDVYMNRDLQMVVCGGIEITDMSVNAVGRRKPPGTEILESYEFIPLNCDAIEQSSYDAVAMIVQIGQENLLQQKIKIIELDDKELKPKPLIQTFDEAIVNVPMVFADLLFLRRREQVEGESEEEKLEIDHVTIEDTELKAHTNCQYIILSHSLSNTDLLTEVKSSLAERGFVILREDINLRLENVECPEDFNLITIIKTPDEVLVMLQRKPESLPQRTPFELPSNDLTFEWVEQLKETLKAGPTILYERGHYDSGILGFTNCLRREPGCDLRCFYIDDQTAPAFDLNDPFYAEQIKLDLAINVYRNGAWGSYRHLTLRRDEEEIPRSGRYYANLTRLGDLSTFEWMPGPVDARNHKKMVNIQYSAINFRDVMLATGRLSVDVHSKQRIYQQCVIGFEYSGTNSRGDRLAGMSLFGGMATQTDCLEFSTWNVPKTMSLRDAATIPVVYATIYYAFFFYRPISKGKSILIHAGSGGVGLAAIRIALAYEMEVYTTVSTEQKKKFIMEQYPQLKEKNIGNSRDCSFEQMIAIRTRGKGVDYVLNSLAEDKLAASVRCLGMCGVFLEIGKFDIMNNSKLDLAAFAKEIEFRTVMADNLFNRPEELRMVHSMVQKDLDNGLIQPLPTTVFEVYEIEKAFRYLSTGKHVGKVLVQVRENEMAPVSKPMRIFARSYCDPEMVYIIAGGLGGFGLELADWMVLRGARKLVLSSRSGVTTGYQKYRIALWESYGCKIYVNKADIKTYEGCQTLINESAAYGQVGGIFNLAVQLQDNIFENQTSEKFVESFAPKVQATRFLDELSRKLCKQLQYFIVFSSASCGRGNPGQSNYGMANSVMERVIEKRVRDNVAGISKAIQWGAVGEVGLVAQMAGDKIDFEVAGTIQQRISACLNVLDNLLNSKESVVSSMVVAQKHATSKMNLIQSVLHIMGIRDIKSVSKNATLAELGMDSLMAVEIKQVIEREFEINLTAQDLRTLTFAKLQELTDAKTKDDIPDKALKSISLADMQKNMLFRSLGEEKTADQTILQLNEVPLNEHDSCALLIPGVEGVVSPILRKMASVIEIPVYGLQTHGMRDETNFSNLISSLSKELVPFLGGKKKFYLIGHSFGGVIAAVLAKSLEDAGLSGQVVCIDGSLQLFKKFLKVLMPNMEPTIDNIQHFLLEQLAFEMLPDAQPEAIRKVLEDEKTYEARLEKYISLMEKRDYSEDHLKRIGTGVQNRFKIVLSESEVYTGEKCSANMCLVRPTTNLVLDMDSDYGFNQYTTGAVSVHIIEGNHLTVLDNPKLYEIVNDICTSDKPQKAA